MLIQNEDWMPSWRQPVCTWNLFRVFLMDACFPVYNSFKIDFILGAFYANPPYPITPHIIAGAYNRNFNDF